MFGAGRIGKRRISVDHYYPDRGMELVSALDVEGDCKEPHMPQELKLSPPKCAFHPLSNGRYLYISFKLEEKQVQPNLNFDHILVAYGFQADYNFHTKFKSAWESRLPCVSAPELLHGIDADSANILHEVHAAVERGVLGSFVATWTVGGHRIVTFRFARMDFTGSLAWHHSIH
ncbi:hypothetical protein DAPPUDRAFT_269745 [Daphnia pulex]|uniref:Uncharacterized protein n=1 Tax=Daphnia pulex TaxID=6669 RepID=E9HZP9_DAPPU|nr:hypothetical protein DAPPUDRAFT_269745 [Daphnia pulex]|eukprot:EFX62781.1 hypothetical protein DAPPUDRAFT_269745 [Daphnia pulex]